VIQPAALLIWMTCLAVSDRQHPEPFMPNSLDDVFVAHAGGRVLGMAYTNSLEALEANYNRGFRVFEIDFSWTADGRLVLIHDWDQTWARFSPAASDVPTLSEFLHTSPSSGLTLLSLEGLIEWLRRRPDAKVITDVKLRNVEALQLIAQQAPELSTRILPQIYHPEEYAPVRASGFDSVLLTTYRLNLAESEIIEFITKNALAALVIPEHRAKRGEFLKVPEDFLINVFVHTINDPRTWEALNSKGYHGIYTDDLFE